MVSCEQSSRNSTFIIFGCNLYHGIFILFFLSESSNLCGHTLYILCTNAVFLNHTFSSFSSAGYKKLCLDFYWILQMLRLGTNSKETRPSDIKPCWIIKEQTD